MRPLREDVEQMFAALTDLDRTETTQRCAQSLDLPGDVRRAQARKAVIVVVRPIAARSMHEEFRHRSLEVRQQYRTQSRGQRHRGADILPHGRIQHIQDAFGRKRTRACGHVVIHQLVTFGRRKRRSLATHGGAQRRHSSSKLKHCRLRRLGSP